MRIHQLGSALGYGDAVTNHILTLDRLFKQWGLASAVYGQQVEDRLAHLAQPDTALVEHLDTPDDLLIYHYSVYCDNIDLYRRARQCKMLIYHNITPAHFFAPYNAELESLCLWGRAALPDLADCDLALGVSEYNRQELVAAGFEPSRTGVLPILLDLDQFATTARDERVYQRLRRDGATNILFVGRVTPNKAFEDIIKLFAAYHTAVNPRAQLWLVGARILPLYNDVLDRLVARLGLGEAVTFTDRVTLAELKAYYEGADAFVCASRHEGFCVPLIEAMHFGIPILARAETAIPATLDGAGVLYHQPSYDVLAETLGLMVEPDGVETHGRAPLRAQLIARQRQRLADFAPARVINRLRAVLSQVGVPLPSDATV